VNMGQYGIWDDMGWMEMSGEFCTNLKISGILTIKGDIIISNYLFRARNRMFK
jgi:hypothetical protein